MSCFFSIIIPVYNTEKYLKQCVESVLTQTFGDFEIVLVDDGSKDDSPRICDEFSKEDSRVRVIHKENGGASSARNKGIGAAFGDYFIFLDSDDYFYTSDSLEKIKAAIEKSLPDVLLFKSYKYYQPDKFVDYYGDYDMKVFEGHSPEKVFRYTVKENKQFASPCNKAVKGNIVKEKQLFFEEGITAEDIKWSVELFTSVNKVDAVNELLYVYRQEVSTSVTASFSEKKFFDLYGIITSITEKYEKANDGFADAVRSFMAFEYAILLFNISCFEDYKKYKFVSEYKWLLKYALDKKTKAVKYTYRILGFNGLMMLLRLKRRVF